MEEAIGRQLSPASIALSKYGGATEQTEELDT
jgi:hypothetical protein